MYTYFLLVNCELHPTRQPLLILLTTLRGMVKFCHDAAILIQESIFQGQLLHLVLFDPAEIHSVHFLVDTMQIICSPTKNKSHRYQNYDTFQLCLNSDASDWCRKWLFWNSFTGSSFVLCLHWLKTSNVWFWSYVSNHL